MAPKHKRAWLKMSALCLIFLWATMSAAGVVASWNLPPGSQRPGAGMIILAALGAAFALTLALQPVLIVATAVSPESGVGRDAPVRKCPICRAKIDRESKDDRCPVCGGLVTRDAA